MKEYKEIWNQFEKQFNYLNELELTDGDGYLFVGSKSISDDEMTVGLSVNGDHAMLVDVLGDALTRDNALASVICPAILIAMENSTLFRHRFSAYMTEFLMQHNEKDVNLN